jgi:hypothetical protein
MNASQNLPKARQFLAETPEVVNVSRELGDYNMYLQDAALQEAVQREGAGWAHDELIAFGNLVGAADYRALGALLKEIDDLADIEYRARDVVDRMALAIQAALLLQHAPTHVAAAFCASRLTAGGHRNYGTLPRGVDCEAIIERATPRA